MPQGRQPTPGSYEVELKVRADHDPILQRLVRLDAREKGTLHQEDTYYQAPHRDLSASDEALRIRIQGPVEPDAHGSRSGAPETRTHRLTYKGPRLDGASKTRAEREVEIDDPGAMDAILRALGFQSVARVRKERRSFVLRGFEVALDRVEGLGTFVEVEIPATDDTREQAARRARELLRDLGLDPERQIRTSYLELLHPAAPEDG